MENNSYRHIHCQESGQRSSNGYLESYNQPYKHNVKSSPTVSYQEEYDFTHQKRGISIIINNDSFDELAERKGSENDTINLERCFNKLGFDVRVAVNLTRYETVQFLKIAAVEMTRNKDFDCFALIISSHGDSVKQTGNRKSIILDIIHCIDEPIPTNDILEIFSDENCPGLVGKPRLCFLQACRGLDLDAGVPLGGAYSLHTTDALPHFNNSNDVRVSQKLVTSPLPCMKDFLVMYATPPGFHAFRRIQEGSWFITVLTSVLENITEERCDINKLLRMVVRKVAYNYRSFSESASFDHKKQTPCIYSMLTKALYLRPKNKLHDT